MLQKLGQKPAAAKRGWQRDRQACGKGREGSAWGQLTCDIDVVVRLQPGLHADKVVLIHQEDDVLGPVDLTWGRKGA